MAAKKASHLGPLIRVEVLRPNGALLSTEDLMASTHQGIERHCDELRARVRNECGWTPTFRIWRIDRDVSPWRTTDVTAEHRVN